MKVKCIKLTRKLLSLLALLFHVHNHIKNSPQQFMIVNEIKKHFLLMRYCVECAGQVRNDEDLCLSFCYSNFLSSIAHHHSIPASLDKKLKYLC